MYANNRSHSITEHLSLLYWVIKKTDKNTLLY